MDKVVPIDEEYIFEGRVAISQTDLKGTITFVNRKFSEISDYSVLELVDSNHDIIRHPNVSQSIFDKMWTSLSNGQVWNGMMKNLRKDGKFYWVDMEIAPIRNQKDEITGYISVSKPAARKNIAENEKLLTTNNTN